MMALYTRHATPPVIDTEHGDDWRERGACRNENPELFYPLGGENGHRRSGANLLQEEQAKRVCGGCPVRVDCRTWALESGDEWGIWGGLNEAERKALRAPKSLSPALKAAQARSAEIRAARIAERTHCDKGHELTAENTYHDRSQRVCRPCRLEYQRTYRETHKAVRA